jgi:hypothetical protein
MAGYFVDQLTHLYPNATVAYFFCRSGKPGLTKAREIIRTVAYQIAATVSEARSILESLRTKAFRIDETAGVAFLVETLLQGPLSATKKDVFLIIDGLDESDRTVIDVAERQTLTEIEILIRSLSNIPARLMFISRPVSDISRLIPNSITKSLGKEDNMGDIDAYVRTTIQSSARLKDNFESLNINPFEYFRKNANGIFLWVVIVLHHLSQTKLRSKWKESLETFSDSDGDVLSLYSTGRPPAAEAILVASEPEEINSTDVELPLPQNPVASLGSDSKPRPSTRSIPDPVRRRNDQQHYASLAAENSVSSLVLEYADVAMAVLEREFRTVAAILDDAGLGGTVEILAGYDLIPFDAGNINADCREFFTGMTSAITIT